MSSLPNCSCFISTCKDVTNILVVFIDLLCLCWLLPDPVISMINIWIFGTAIQRLWRELSPTPYLSRCWETVFVVFLPCRSASIIQAAAKVIDIDRARRICGLGLQPLFRRRFPVSDGASGRERQRSASWTSKKCWANQRDWLTYWHVAC